MNILRLLFPLLMMALLAGCSDNKEDKTESPEMDRAAVMQDLVRQTEIYAKQEEERKQKLIDARERPLLIGVVSPETGEEADFGKSVVNGVLAAAKRFNAQGGIAGKEIKVLHYDDASNMGNTNKIVSYLIREGAIAILSAPTGSSTFTPVHLTESSKTILISIGSRRRIERSGPYVFRTAIPDEMATEDLIKYATTELGYVNYALVTSSIYDFSLDLSAMFKKAIYKNSAVIKLEADVYDTYTGGINVDE
ncbi:MAG: ABC transporter substrate-binding protein, partial [Mariprofundaceae bacterium]